MKTKKALAVLLAVAMLVMPFAVSSFAAFAGEILTNPIKVAYTDAEHFNPQGLVILVDGDDIEYTPADSKFRFDPAPNELLTVETTAVDVYYDNVLICAVPVTVNHILDEKLTPIDNGHGNFCLGCGKLHNFEAHTVTEWIPNDDGGIFVMQTQTGVCTVCNAEVTENIPGSEKFMSLFDLNTEGSMTDLELTIITYVYSIAVSLIQTLIGIS